MDSGFLHLSPMMDHPDVSVTTVRSDSHEQQSDDTVQHGPPQPIKAEANVKTVGLSITRHPHGKDKWLPPVLRWPVPLVLVSLHAVYVGVLEAAIQKVNKADSNELSISINHGNYFLWQFLPVLGAVILGNIWEAVDVNIRRLQPFFLMARDSGASAAESVLLDYVTEFAFLVPFLAARKGHWLVFVSSLAYLIAATATPALSTQMWDVSWENVVIIHVVWIRVLQGINAALAIFAIVVLVLIPRKRSGLVREPMGPASLASILSGSRDLIKVLCQLPSNVSHAQLKSALEAFKFYLTRSSEDGDDSGIIVQVRSVNASATPDLRLFRVPTNVPPTRAEAHPRWLWGRYILLEELVLLAPYIVVQVASGRFGLSSMSKIDPWVAKACYTAAFTVIVLGWQSVQRELAILESYYQLATLSPHYDGSSHTPITLDYISQPPLQVIGYAFITCAPLLGFVSFISLSQQCMVVFLPPIWKSLYEGALQDITEEVPAVLKTSLTITAALTWPVAILSFIVVIFILRRRRKPILPRQPRTLASQLLYLCGSVKLLDQLRETSLMSARELREHVRTTDKRYSCGWFKSAGDVAEEETVWRVGIEEIPVEYVYKFPETTPVRG